MAPPLPDNPLEEKINEPLIAKLQDNLKNYKTINETSERDILDNRYRIDLAQALPEFDTPHARAYTARDALEPSKTLFAHVCEWGSIQRNRVISLLKGMEHRYIVQVLAGGNVSLSTTGEERYVIFYERPTGIRLSELMKRKKIPLNLPFIYEHILAPLANALQQFAELGISHGLVNPDNIFISDVAMLGPCVADPCGYSQPFCFESVERIQALPSAKGEGSITHDFYALAVVLLYILHGEEHFAAYTRENLIRTILRQGAYNALMLEKEVPEVLYDFFRGALTLSAEERWSGRQILPWLAGKRFNVLPPPPPADAVRPFEFGETLANTRRELAHLFCADWAHMISSLNNNQLAHWVSVSLRNKELSDMVTRLSRTAYDLSTKNETATYESLMNIIMMLDPAGPVRIKHLSMHIDGLDTMCAELYASKSHQDLQFLAKFIESNMVNYWLELQNKLHKDEYTIPATINTINIKLDRLRGCIRNSGYGFGLERMLYDLNPDMACISPVLASYNVTTLTEMLIQLDRLAPVLSNQEEPIDRHIAAFIASKLIILREIRLDDLSSIPSLATNRTMLAIYLLGLAQLRTGSLRLPGLTHWLVLRTLPLMNFIHSRTVRQKYKAALMSLASSGYIPQLADLIVSADYAANDQKSYQQALNLFERNAGSIAYYEAAENVAAEAMQMGFNIARMVGYVCLFASVFFVTRGM